VVSRDHCTRDWQSDFSVSYIKVGDVEREQNNLTGALKSCRETLGIAETLAKRDHRNARWQSDLAWGYWRTGFAWVKVEPKSQKDARAMVETGRKILHQLKNRMGLNVEQQEWLDSNRSRTIIMPGAADDILWANHRWQCAFYSTREAGTGVPSLFPSPLRPERRFLRQRH
jgi:hypothetical protein